MRELNKIRKYKIYGDENVSERMIKVQINKYKNKKGYKGFDGEKHLEILEELTNIDKNKIKDIINNE